MDIILTVYHSKESDAKFISLLEIFKALGLREPYARWATRQLRKYALISRRKKEKTGGRPKINYFVRLDEAEDMLSAIERKHKVKFK